MDDRTASDGGDPDREIPDVPEMVAAEPTGDGEPADGEARTTLVDGDVIVAEDDDDTETADEPEQSDMARRRRALLDWVVVIGVALLVAFVVRTFVLAHFVVDGTSMYTTLHDGDRVFVNKLSYRLHDPNRGDVVVLHQITGAVRARPHQAGHRPAGRDDRDPQLRGAHRRRACSTSRTSTPRSSRRATAAARLAPVDGPRRPRVRDGRQPGRLAGQPRLGPIDEDDLVGRAFVVFWPQADWQWL